jgi:hypothetical protein
MRLGYREVERGEVDGSAILDALINENEGVGL